jgi:hypothetical protein
MSYAAASPLNGSGELYSVLPGLFKPTQNSQKMRDSTR